MLLSMRPCWVQVLACTADCQPADGPGDHNRSEPYGRRQDHYVSDIGPSSIASRQLYQLSTIKREGLRGCGVTVKDTCVRKRGLSNSMDCPGAASLCFAALCRHASALPTRTHSWVGQLASGTIYWLLSLECKHITNEALLYDKSLAPSLSLKELASNVWQSLKCALHCVIKCNLLPCFKFSGTGRALEGILEPLLAKAGWRLHDAGTQVARLPRQDSSPPLSQQ